MLNCRQATVLMSQSQDRPLAATERLPLRWHLLWCTGCRNYSQQVTLLRQATRQHPDRSPGRPD